jgi:AAA+ ATPase superfamily predicted ATPase
MGMEHEIFVGREKEMQELKDLLNKKTASFVVVKGRRRIGKSRLLEEFCKGLKTFKFMGLPPTDETTLQSQLDEFSRQLSEATGLPEAIVDDWSKQFTFLARESRKGRLVIIFDEISWIGSKDSDFLGKLKNAWDNHFKKNPKLIFIVCGSISTWIDDNILNSTAFYGRVSWTINLMPLPLHHCNQLLKALGFKGSDYEKFKILSVMGGIPWYLEQIQGQFNADDNIARQCFTKGGVLLIEFDKIFHEVFGKRDKIYKEIVEVLGNGPAEYEAIAKLTEYQSSGRLSQYLANLVSAGFVSRDYTWALTSGKETKISHFRLSDNYLRFYLKYIAPHAAAIEKERFKKIALSSLPGWETIMGLQFENLVLNNREKLLSALNIRVEDVIADNPYIRKKTSRQSGCQIDYLIQTKFKNLYPCEIKFSRQPVTMKVVDEMKEKIKRLTLPRGTSALPVLLHVNGVTESVIESDYFFAIINFSDLIK